MARIVALVNQKGGVAKTTSCLALGAALADRGQRVLLVDLDPQASLTSATGVDVAPDAPTLYTALHAFISTGDALDLSDVIRGVTISLDLAPASIELAGAELELQNAVRREYVLGEVLSAVQGAYDTILLDCPPSLSLLTVNALAWIIHENIHRIGLVADGGLVGSQSPLWTPKSALRPLQPVYKGGCSTRCDQSD